MRAVLRVLIVAALFVPQAARAQNAAFAAALKQATWSLGAEDGKLTGTGARVLSAAIDDAQFVMLGEDHGIEQVPALAAALCGELGPRGFRRMAIEVGPSVAPELERFAGAADGTAQASAFAKAFPEAIAFYDWKEELAMLQRCAKAAGGLEIWGLDQELMGATQLVLRNILATKPGPVARAAIVALLRDADAARVEAAKTGDYGKLYLLTGGQAALDGAKAALAKDATPAAQAMFAALLESRAIYQGQASATPWLSNRQRARLMKSTFTDRLGAAAVKEQQLPKVFLKLGAWHLYHGVNPLRSSEIGALVTEIAEGHKVSAVNLAVLGVKGQQLHPAGVGRPAAAGALDLAHDKDSDFRWLAPLFAAQVAKAWTLFDLRALRPSFGTYGKLDGELERLIFGYDFLVLIGDPRASHPL
jgi:hypothetical protein